MSGDVDDQRARRYVQGQALASHVRGGPRERQWLDLLHLMDQDDAARTAEDPAPTDAREALDDSQVPGPLLFLVREVRAERDAARDALARVEAELERSEETWTYDEDGDAWVEVAVIRAALAPTAPDAGNADRRAREAEHGTWDKDQQRYADGCKADAPPHASDAGQRDTQERVQVDDDGPQFPAEIRAEALRDAADALAKRGHRSAVTRLRAMADREARP